VFIGVCWSDVECVFCDDDDLTMTRRRRRMMMMMMMMLMPRKVDAIEV
jgi:hypothetical protein